MKLTAPLLCFAVILVSASSYAASFLHQLKLVGVGESTTNSYRGRSVSISADGNYALFGGWGTNNNKGGVWVYARVDGSWSEQATGLLGVGVTGSAASQGIGITISGDGKTILSGGPGDNLGKGATWVFVRSGQAWLQQDKLIHPSVNPSGTRSEGSAVALSHDGNTALVGGRGENSGAGAAFIFYRLANSTWVAGPKLPMANLGNEVAYAGSSVDLSANGNVAIVGGYAYDNNRGAVWTFLRDEDGNWTSTSMLTGTVDNSMFGQSVAISGDGMYAIIGAPQYTQFQGAALVYSWNGVTWSPQANLSSSDLAGSNSDFQGGAVSMNSNGSRAIVGASGRNVFFVFDRQGAFWNQTGEVGSGQGAVGDSFFGCSVDLSADGETAISGGQNDNGGLGAAWIFQGSAASYATLEPTSTPSTSIPSMSGTSPSVALDLYLGIAVPMLVVTILGALALVHRRRSRARPVPPVLGALTDVQQALDSSKPTVMISYQWDSQSTAVLIRDYLLATSTFNVIMDTTGIKGNFLAWMEASLKASHALIIIVTPKYQLSANCRAEACRAHELHMKIIPVIVEPSYIGADWLAPLIAGFMRYDVSTPKALQESLQVIVERELPRSV